MEILHELQYLSRLTNFSSNDSRSNSVLPEVQIPSRLRGSPFELVIRAFSMFGPVIMFVSEFVFVFVSVSAFMSCVRVRWTSVSVSVTVVLSLIHLIAVSHWQR